MQLRAALLASACLLFSLGPIAGAPAPAKAQEQELTVEFRSDLEPYGSWVQHSRWGEVWIPARLPADWRPYQRGHWVYSDEWGWYWDPPKISAGSHTIMAAGFVIRIGAGCGFRGASGDQPG